MSHLHLPELHTVEDLPNLPGIKRDGTSYNPRIFKKLRKSCSDLLQGIGGQTEQLGHSSSIQSYEGLGCGVSSAGSCSEFDGFDCNQQNPFDGIDSQNFRDLAGRYSLIAQRHDRDINFKNYPFNSSSALPDFIQKDKQALCFLGYFAKPMMDGFVRVCTVAYMMDGGLLDITERKSPNCGIMFAKVVAGKRVSKTDANGESIPGSFIGIEDLFVGSTIRVYGQDICIVDCDAYTRKMLKSEYDIDMPGQLPIPESVAVPGFSTFSSHARIAPPTSPIQEMSRSMKRYKLLNDSVLRFFCVMDDRDRMFGDLLMFAIHYFVCDDTMELVQRNQANDGRDRLPLSLERGRVPKPNANEDHHDDEFWFWRDFDIGKKISIFGRVMLILDVDDFTRNWYQDTQGIKLHAPLQLDPVRYPELPTTIPPSTGFGSEEDSLQTCGNASFDLRPPKKDGLKAKMKCGQIMRFCAKFNSTNVLDKQRNFVINYFLEDDTIAITEIGLRNSGYASGKFLSRRKIPKTVHRGESAEQHCKATDFYVGSTIRLNDFLFDVVDADEFTFRYMESHSEAEFPQSNLSSACEKIINREAAVHRALLMMQRREAGRIQYDELIQVFKNAQVGLQKQETITVLRALDRKKKGSVSEAKVFRMLKDMDWVRLNLSR